eukprot:TRINITY_DN13344_c0_g1_i1.p1 TRINITY_DN13344_c0_g1~~TRINITY_DN13344_c0_g1_i1.p1  ORF type:complete len:170 (+),score=27.23 TRINITY_DN13344_c0_g1_i1:206-715(+)
MRLSFTISCISPLTSSYQDKLLLTTKRKIKVPKLQLSCLHKKGIAGKKYTVLESSSTKALTGDLKFGEPKKLVIRKHKKGRNAAEQYAKIFKTERTKGGETIIGGLVPCRIKLSPKLSSILNNTRSTSRITLKNEVEDKHLDESNTTVIEKDCDNDYSLIYNSLRLIQK